MQNFRPTPSPAQQGYSLSELLVVVAIIGVLSLITIPNFISMQRQRQLKTSLIQFANDARGARQRAVTNSSTVRISFAENGRAYYMFESTDEGKTWNALGRNPRMLQDRVKFIADTTGAKFTDTIDDGALGDLPDVVFERTGVARAPNGLGKLHIKSEFERIGKNSYAVSVRTTGMVLSE